MNKLTAESMNDDGMQNLISAIVTLAVRDIQRGGSNGKSESAIKRQQNYGSAISFIKSEWFEFMTDVSGKEFLKQIEWRSGKSVNVRATDQNERKPRGVHTKTFNETGIKQSCQRVMRDLSRTERN